MAITVRPGGSERLTHRDLNVHEVAVLPRSALLAGTWSGQPDRGRYAPTWLVAPCSVHFPNSGAGGRVEKIRLPAR